MVKALETNKFMGERKCDSNLNLNYHWSVSFGCGRGKYVIKQLKHDKGGKN